MEMGKLTPRIHRQELGRASWKLLHTMLARYPVAPTPDEREALHSYIMLFGRLYPWYGNMPLFFPAYQDPMHGLLTRKTL